MKLGEKTLLLFCFVVSGATSLTLEVAWSKELSYILGNTLYSVSSVVAAFMLGLGLGGALAGRIGPGVRRPLRAYALVQLGVGLCGLVSIPVLRRMQPLFEAVYTAAGSHAGSFLLVRFLMVFALMLIPAMLMGMTLPVVTGALGRSKQEYEAEAGLAYGWNTLGAVLGTLAGGFTLIPALGLLGTCVLASFCDFGIALLALGLDARIGPIADIRQAGDSTAMARGGWSPRQWWIGILFGVSGMVALALEVGWFRLLGLAVGPSVYAFAAMLGTYLTGVGLGSALGSRWMAWSRVRGLPAMAILEAALGIVGLLSLHYMNGLPTLAYRVLQGAIENLGEAGLGVAQVGVSATVVLLPCLILGVLFPVSVRAIVAAGPSASPERTVGRLYMLNTAGGIAGSLAAGFWWIPSFGVWATLIGSGLASGGIAVALLLADDATSPPRRSLGAIVALGLTLTLAWLAPAWDVTLFNQGLYRDGYKGTDLPRDRLQGEELIFYREGVNAPVAVMSFSGGATLFVSGKPDASTHIEDHDTQLFLGHLPVLFTPNPRRAAVIGYGSGATAHAMLTHAEVESLDILEIEAAVVEASPYFESINENPFDDPRTRLILEDGRTHLTYADTLYDCISSEPSNPWMAGVASLFTVDFYRIVRSRLAENGVFAQWIQDYEISEETYRVLLASLHEVFPYLVVFRPTWSDSIILASGKPIAVPWDIVRQRFEGPAASASLRRTSWKKASQVFFSLQATTESVERFVAGDPRRNTDDNVWLERRMPFEMVGAGQTRARAGLRLSGMGAHQRVAAFTAIAPGLPLEEVLRDTLLYPHGLEPVIGPDAVLSDPWHDLRTVLTSGLRQELGAMQRPDLVAQVDAWEAQGEAYRKARETAAARLRPMALRQSPTSPQVIDEVLAEMPDLPLVHLMAGQVLEGAREYDQAEPFYREVAAHPESRLYDNGLLGLVRLAHLRGNRDEALKLVERGMAESPYASMMYLQAAYLRSLGGDTPGARAILERGLKLSPKDKNLEDMLARLAAR